MHRLTRRSIALVAAYAVALQVLLLPLGIALASPFVTEHCTTEQPLHQSQGCPCAAGCGTTCCEHTLAAPPAEFSAAELSAAAADLVVTATVEAARPFAHIQQSARAPPLSALI
jgi:hypothetical protein